MTPERELELAREMGLDKVPEPRMAVPKAKDEIPKYFRPNFTKALSLVDPIETAAFDRFIPDCCVIDQRIDPRIYSGELSFSVLARTDRPPPVNEKIMAVTGLDGTMNAMQYYIWLGLEVKKHWFLTGAKRMAPPLIFRTNRPIWKPWIIPFVGVMMKFDRTPADGSTMRFRDVGVLAPRHAFGFADPGHTPEAA